jgi:hypothetical protein
MTLIACRFCNGLSLGSYGFIHTKDCPSRDKGEPYYNPKEDRIVIYDPSEHEEDYMTVLITNELVEEMLEQTASNFTSHRHKKEEYNGALRETIANYLELMKLEQPDSPENVGLRAMRPGDVEVKTVGQLIDELAILNIKIWMLIDKVMAGTATPEEAQSVQVNNSKRNEYVRAIDRRLGQADIGGKVYDR